MSNCRCTRCEVDRSTLGLHQPATFDIVARSYKDLARVWHPDRFESDPRLRLRAEEEFKRVQQAFTGLKEHETETPVQEPFTGSSHTAGTAPQTSSPPPPPPLTEMSFFSVSLVKLAVLSLSTFGIYELYWLYRQWKAIQQRTGARISPFWRTFFTPLFCYSCFSFIAKEGRRQGLDRAPVVGLLTVAWILCRFAALPAPWWLLTLSSVFFLLPIQAYANRIIAVEAPVLDKNSRFTLWNWLTAVLGGIWVVLAIFGTLLPDK